MTSFGIQIPKVNPYTGQTETCYAYAADIHFVPAESTGRIVFHVHPTKADADANRQPIDRLIVTLQATSDGGPTYPDQVNAHPTIYGALAQAIQQLALQVYPDATAYGTP